MIIENLSGSETALMKYIAESLDFYKKALTDTEALIERREKLELLSKKQP